MLCGYGCKRLNSRVIEVENGNGHELLSERFRNFLQAVKLLGARYWRY